MSDEIKDITIHYLSGRDEKISTAKAMEVLAQNKNRVNWVAGREILFERTEPLLRMSREDGKYIFETPSATRIFDNLEALKKDVDANTLWQVYCNQRH